MDEQTHDRRLPRLARRAARQGHAPPRRAEQAEAEVRAAGRRPAAPRRCSAARPPTGVGGPIPAKEGYGDCIDCNACVNVCPTGIDIRDGQQLACITCALCIDACDDVMDKVGKPRGLIGYVTLADGERERAGGAAGAGLAPHPAAAGPALHRALGRHRRRAGRGARAAHRHVDVGRPGAQPAQRHPLRRLDPQRLRAPPAQHDRLRPRLPPVRRRRARRSPSSCRALPGLTVTVPANETLRQRVYLTSAPDSPANAEPLTPVELVAEDAGSGRQAREETVFHGRQP